MTERPRLSVDELLLQLVPSPQDCGGGVRTRNRVCVKKEGRKLGCFNDGPFGDRRFREMTQECNRQACPSKKSLSNMYYTTIHTIHVGKKNHNSVVLQCLIYIFGQQQVLSLTVPCP